MTVVAPTWQRLEGLALLVLAALAYSRFGQGWALFSSWLLTSPSPAIWRVRAQAHGPIIWRTA